MRATSKNFLRFEKFLGGVNFGDNQKRASPLSLAEHFRTFCTPRRGVKTLKILSRDGATFGAEWRCPRPSPTAVGVAFLKAKLYCDSLFFLFC